MPTMPLPAAATHIMHLMCTRTVRLQTTARPRAAVLHRVTAHPQAAELPLPAAAHLQAKKRLHIPVAVVGKTDNWYQILFNDQLAYMSADYLRAVNE